MKSECEAEHKKIADYVSTFRSDPESSECRLAEGLSMLREAMEWMDRGGKPFTSKEHAAWSIQRMELLARWNGGEDANRERESDAR